MRPVRCGSWRSPASTGPAALIATVASPTTSTAVQTALTRGPRSRPRVAARRARAPRRSPRSGSSPNRTPQVAAITGTPAGVSGVSSSAMPPPASAAARARRLRTSGTSSARKSAGKAASRPSVAGSPRVPPATHADHGTADPAGVQDKARAEHAADVEAAVLLRHRPALVDEQLRLGHAPGRAAAEAARGREPHRPVARVEEHGGGDRRDDGAAGREHRHDGELGRAGEGRGAHDDRGDRVEAGRAGEHAEGRAEQEHRRGQREDRAGAGRVAGGLLLRLLPRRFHETDDRSGCMENQVSHRISFRVQWMSANLIRWTALF